jgi:hypothetical protein
MGLQLFHTELELGRAWWVGWILVVPRMAGAQQGLKGSGLGGGAVSWWVVVLAPGWGLAQTGGGDPGGRGSSSMNNMWVFQHGVASAAEGRVSCCVWVWNRVVAWHIQRGREPSRTEQWLCRPMGWGFGRLAVLILDCGVVKPSTVLVCRVPCFWLSVELYLSQACLQLLRRISESAHEVCGSVSVTILDLLSVLYFIIYLS